MHTYTYTVYILTAAIRWHNI